MGEVLTQKRTCHIRQYSTEGRDPDTKEKRQVFIASCDPHGWRAEKMTRHGRSKAVEAHELSHAE
jgi:hypothetical protein